MPIFHGSVRGPKMGTDVLPLCIQDTLIVPICVERYRGTTPITRPVGFAALCLLPFAPSSRRAWLKGWVTVERYTAGLCVALLQLCGGILLGVDFGVSPAPRYGVQGLDLAR